MNDRGSALLLAVFMLAFLAGLGIALHFQSQGELMMSAADRQAQQAYFLAEAGIEAGRQLLYDTNGDGSFDNDLVAAAAANGDIDLDHDKILKNPAHLWIGEGIFLHADAIDAPVCVIVQHHGIAVCYRCRKFCVEGF